MLFLFGEQVTARVVEEGKFDCFACGKEQPFLRIEEINYFTIFLFRLVPIRKIAEYCQCCACGTPFVSADSPEPSQFPGIRRVVCYIMLGYRMHRHRDKVKEIFLKITNTPFTDDDIQTEVGTIEQGKEDVFRYLTGLSTVVNTLGKQQIIEAAFLMTYAACEIQHEDRLRINLIGNALGVSLEFVETVIDHVRNESYYGVRRNLVAQ